MDFIAIKKKGMSMIKQRKNGAPDTIRTCDRLVRSPPPTSTFSTACAEFFWPACAASWAIINDLAQDFGRAIDRKSRSGKAESNWLKAQCSKTRQVMRRAAVCGCAIPFRLGRLTSPHAYGAGLVIKWNRPIDFGQEHQHGR